MPLSLRMSRPGLALVPKSPRLYLNHRELNGPPSEAALWGFADETIGLTP